MSLIRPSFQERLHTTLFQLEADRPYYFSLVVRIGRNLFLSMGFNDIVEEIDTMISEYLEKPLRRPFKVIMDWYEMTRDKNPKACYTSVGDDFDAVEFSRYDVTMRLEKIKDYIYDQATELSPLIRFTQFSQAVVQ